MSDAVFKLVEILKASSAVEVKDLKRLLREEGLTEAQAALAIWQARETVRRESGGQIDIGSVKGRLYRRETAEQIAHSAVRQSRKGSRAQGRAVERLRAAATLSEDTKQRERLERIVQREEEKLLWQKS